MAFLAPVVREIPGRVLHYPDAYSRELMGLPESLSFFSFVFCFWDEVPVDDVKRDFLLVHLYAPLSLGEVYDFSF